MHVRCLIGGKKKRGYDRRVARHLIDPGDEILRIDGSVAVTRQAKARPGEIVTRDLYRNNGPRITVYVKDKGERGGGRVR